MDRRRRGNWARSTSSAPTGILDARSGGSGRARQFDYSVVLVLLGGAISLGGVAVGLMPLIQRDMPCFYALSPPDVFTASSATGPTLSWLPFGAQCTYFNGGTGEGVLSAVSPWPTVMLTIGVALILFGLFGIIRALRRAA